MIGGKNVLGVIAARGGSKGLPRKNILPFGGWPLIVWSIVAAKAARYLDRTVVSTDDLEIAAVARAWGGEVPLMRPAELATDDASITDAVLHAVDNAGGSFAYVVLLQATSPLRAADDIDSAISLCHQTGAPACVSVTRVSKGPWWMYGIDHQSRLKPLLPSEPRRRRQDHPPVYMPNGAIYVAELDWLRRNGDFYGEETIAYEMPIERSPDIDTLLDLKLAELMLK